LGEIKNETAVGGCESILSVCQSVSLLACTFEYELSACSLFAESFLISGTLCTSELHNGSGTNTEIV